jgi:hypothetical protein
VWSEGESELERVRLVSKTSFARSCASFVYPCVPIIDVPSSDTSAELLPDHICRDRYIVVSAFAVTSSILLIGYVLSSLLNVCAILSPIQACVRCETDRTGVMQ